MGAQQSPVSFITAACCMSFSASSFLSGTPTNRFEVHTKFVVKFFESSCDTHGRFSNTTSSLHFPFLEKSNIWWIDLLVYCV